MSIRLRLTLLYSTILALTLVAFSATLYGIQARYTLNAHRRELDAQARLIAVRLARTLDEGPSRRPGPDSPPDGPPPVPAGEEVLQDVRVRDHIAFMDTEGVLLDHPINQDDETFPAPPESLQAVRAGQIWSQIVVREDERFLIHSSPIRNEGAVVGVVQLVRSLADRDRSLHALGTALTVGSAAITLAAFGIGWVLSGATLRPIDRITQGAREIGTERDLSRRVPYQGPMDQVGQLAATLNGMLAELQDAHQQLKAALELQQDFVADVSHELRTPLTTLRGNLALLERQPPLPDQEQADVLSDMVDETERLIRLVADLLALARSEAGRLLKIERVPTAELIEDVCRQARLLDSRRTIACETPGAVEVLADRGALKQVLLILLDNAVLHGQDTIRVTVRHDEQADPVTIAVHDRGPGIPSEVRERLFERFYRGQADHKPGLGLGLPIAKALVEAQNGTLSVESQVGKGSTFAVILPAAQSMPSSPSI